MSTVQYFEVPVEQPSRARSFYEKLFGWQFKQVPETEYWTIETEGEQGLHGGMMRRPAYEKAITNYIGISSVDDYCVKVVEFGGRVMAPKTSVKGMGYFAVCMDTEDNVFGLWEDDPAAA